MKLCMNCLDRAEFVKGVRVGPEKGTQRDPYWDSVQLCDLCGKALLEGDFSTLHERYASSREISR